MAIILVTARLLHSTHAAQTTLFGQRRRSVGSATSFQEKRRQYFSSHLWSDMCRALGTLRTSCGDEHDLHSSETEDEVS
jgi:hypothetical protein